MPELCSFLWIMLLASKLCYLIFKQNKGRASGKTQNKQQLITDYIQYKIYQNCSHRGSKNADYAGSAFLWKKLKIMLVLPNYAKNYAGTIDSSLIWTQGLSSPYETLISTPKGLSPLLREMIRLYFLSLPSFTNQLMNLVLIIHVLFLCFP